MLDYFPIFATPVFKGHIDIPDGSLPYWLTKSDLSSGRKKSNRGGWQSSDCRNDPYLNPLKTYLANAVSAFRLQSAWVNINRKGDENVPHCHPGADLSFVWYLTDSTGLKLQNPNVFNQFRILREFEHKEGHFYESINFSFAAGDIIIFPSAIVHSVVEHKEDEPRVSVSGNLEWKPPVTAETEALTLSQLAPLNL